MITLTLAIIALTCALIPLFYRGHIVHDDEPGATLDGIYVRFSSGLFRPQYTVLFIMCAMVAVIMAVGSQSIVAAVVWGLLGAIVYFDIIYTAVPFRLATFAAGIACLGGNIHPAPGVIAVLVIMLVSVLAKKMGLVDIFLAITIFGVVPSDIALLSLLTAFYINIMTRLILRLFRTPGRGMPLAPAWFAVAVLITLIPQQANALALSIFKIII